MDSNFEEIFQGWLEKEELNKNKGFLKKNKQWKKYFCVLRRYDGDDNVYFQWFEKEEDWRREFPNGSFSLFPKYSVFKRKTEKGKNYFEVSNDEDFHYFMAANEKTMDLWIIQLMMQTRLNSSMIETSFRVKGNDTKCLQRIGAKNLNCLLHVSEWGITLALERTHSVLSQWPLTTVRNYECTDNNEFVFEAGRKSPMGEGKYHFLTTNSEDNAIFDQLDRFTSLRAKRVRKTGGRSRLNSGDDQEIAQAYGKLRWSVMLNSSTLNLGVLPAMSSQPQSIVQNEKQIYNHLERKNSSQSTAIADSYDRLDRTGSLNSRISQTTDTSYSRLNCNRSLSERKGSRGTIRSPNDSYDRLERGSSFHGSPSSADARSRSFGSLDGRSRHQFSPYSSPPPEDSYNHLAEYRNASSSTSPKAAGNGTECYDSLDRSTMSIQQGALMSIQQGASMSIQQGGSMSIQQGASMSIQQQGAPMSIQQGAPMSSYDRLDNMQDNVFARRDSSREVFAGQDQTVSPPRPPIRNDTMAYDVFGNRRDHVATPYQSVAPKPGQQTPGGVELPPPLPQKPSFMMKAEKNTDNTPETETVNQNGSDGMNDYHDTKNGTTPNENQATEPENLPDSSSGATENEPSHYQDIDEATTYDTAKPRSRLNTHSSDSDLRKLSLERDTRLDPSKRTTFHRSAPSLALYSVVNKNKSEKGSPRGLFKTGSTFTLDSFLKRIGRTSKKSGEDTESSYEKIPRKSKKSQRKLKKDSSLDMESSSSLRRLVDDEANTYAQINDDGMKSKMERSESKRPLPDIPALDPPMDV